MLTQQVPTSFCLGPADRFLAVLCVCRGFLGNRLVASLLLTQFDMGVGGMMAPQNVFDHCAQTLRKRMMKLGDF